MASEPGTAPVWIFGHGVFSEPDNYLPRQRMFQEWQDWPNGQGPY